MNDVPRMRMFAGPNGSGKSTIKSLLSPALLGVYINPDEIEDEIRQRGFLDLAAYGVHPAVPEILSFFQASALLEKAGLTNEAAQLRFSEGKLRFAAVGVNAYFASVAADFIRHQLIETGTSFTFETVMSSADKVTLLQKARQRGYRTYLYYVATADPLINIARVRQRVTLGGHPVPEEKILSRYERSLNLLMDAICLTNRAYIFDNSEHKPIWLAEITDGKVLAVKASPLPGWFKKAVRDKLTPPPTTMENGK